MTQSRSEFDTPLAPQRYQRALWGCKLEFDFITIKLLDYATSQDELKTNSNPFTIVILIQSDTQLMWANVLIEAKTLAEIFKEHNNN